MTDGDRDPINLLRSTVQNIKYAREDPRVNSLGAESALWRSQVLAAGVLRMLEDRLDEPGAVMADGGTVLACPKCGKSTVTVRAGGPNARNDIPDGSEDYVCRNCSARFDDPVERPAKSDQDPNALAEPGKELLDADPETIPDGGRQAKLANESESLSQYYNDLGARPSDCRCREGDSLVCWPCNLAGFEEVNPEAPETDVDFEEVDPA